VYIRGDWRLSLANESAVSLPVIPMWLGIQIRLFFVEVFGYDVSYWCKVVGVFIEVFNRVKGGEGVGADCVFSRLSLTKFCGF